MNAFGLCKFYPEFGKRKDETTLIYNRLPASKLLVRIPVLLSGSLLKWLFLKWGNTVSLPDSFIMDVGGIGVLILRLFI